MISGVRAVRRAVPSSGLAGFPKKATGVAALGKVVHRSHDGRLIEAHRKERSELKRSQGMASSAVGPSQAASCGIAPGASMVRAGSVRFFPWPRCVLRCARRELPSAP